MFRPLRTLVAVVGTLGLLMAVAPAAAGPHREPWGVRQVLRKDGEFHVATDGVTAVVSDFKWQSGTGKALVFGWDGERWAWRQTLVSPDPPPAVEGDGFGFAAAVHGDVIAIGKLAEHTCVYVYEFRSGRWRHAATIEEANGRAIAVWDDMVAITTEVMWDDAPDPEIVPATVAIYQRGTLGWTKVGTLEPSARYDGCEFGASIDLHREVLVVGDVHGHDPCFPKVHVFRRTGGSWRLEQELTAPGGDGNLPSWVGVWGDTIAVGDPAYKIDDVAKVHIYRWTGRYWQHLQILKRPSEGFGNSVALQGTTLAVGDYETGDTWVYTRVDNPWSPGSYGTWQSARYLRNGPGTGRYVAVWGPHVLTSDNRADAYLLRTCRGLVPTVVGTHGNDTITGTSANDAILGLGGDDVLVGADGHDVICGNGGRDRLVGGKGNDVLLGGGDDDRLYGRAGNDRLGPMAGNDVVVGGTGFDGVTYHAVTRAVAIDLATGVASGSGTDTLESLDWARGSPADDVIRGTDSRNILRGGPGDDLLIGRAGDDTLLGGSGTDEARGGSGTDHCKAEAIIGCE